MLLLLSSTIPASAGWVDGINVPRGYRIVQRHRVASGVYHLALRRRRPDEVIHVARLAKESPHRLRVLLSNGLVAGPVPRTERTTTMCTRARCLIAINGDFFSEAGHPVGGVIDDARPIRSPIDSRPHLTQSRDGNLRIGRLDLTTTLTTSHAALPDALLGGAPTQRNTEIRAVNRIRGADQIVLYTPRYGPTTGTRSGFEITARLVTPAAGIVNGVPTAIELTGARSYGSAIPSDGVVLSGHGTGAEALAALWREVTGGTADRNASVTVNADSLESVAGKPVLVRDGQRVVRSRSQRDARTMIGWNSRGDLLLVTVDGQQRGRSVGLSVIDGANLMRALGAVHALNLDGGGSTTFVLRSRLMNRPNTSGYRERRVAVAVAIVPA